MFIAPCVALHFLSALLCCWICSHFWWVAMVFWTYPLMSPDLHYVVKSLPKLAVSYLVEISPEDMEKKNQIGTFFPRDDWNFQNM
jgi:hypothetical protein